MTRKKARILVMLLSVACLLSVTCLCFAETPSIIRYKHTSRITAYLGISGGTADCRGSVAPSEPVFSCSSWIQYCKPFLLLGSIERLSIPVILI